MFTVCSETKKGNSPPQNLPVRFNLYSAVRSHVSHSTRCPGPLCMSVTVPRSFSPCSSTSSHQGSWCVLDGSLWLNEKWGLSIGRIDRRTDVYVCSFTLQTHIFNSEPRGIPESVEAVCTHTCSEMEYISGHPWFIMQPTRNCQC